MDVLPAEHGDAVRHPRKPKRRMVRAELMGGHSHETTAGVTVHIYQRDGKFLARGRHRKQSFGETLGPDELKATSRLRQLLYEIEKGTYVRPSAAAKRPLNNGVVPQYSLRELASEFLAEKRGLRGAKTAGDYKNRLGPCLEFAEIQESSKQWPLARHIDREFVLDLRQFLMRRTVTRNGRPGAAPKRMSSRHVQNCLETLRSMLAWAVRADIRKLPAEFVNPVSHDLIGPKPSKDPLRKSKVPIERRIEMIRKMDKWELLHLAASMILPLRFEDVAGALITDVDFAEGTLHLGNRFGGDDYNKGKVDVEMPLPEELVSIFRSCAGERIEGPLLRGRTVWQECGAIQLPANSREDMERLFDEALGAARANEIQTEQDRKQVFRKLLRRMGGISEQQLGKSLKSLFGRAGLGNRIRPYDLRGSVTTDMKDAGIQHLELRYLTMHSVNDILNEYTGLDPVGEMKKYYTHCRPLRQAIRERASQLGLSLGSRR